MSKQAVKRLVQVGNKPAGMPSPVAQPVLAEPALVSLGRAAQLCGVSKEAMRYMVRAGTIRCIQIGASGTRFKVPMAEIERLRGGYGNAASDRLSGAQDGTAR